MDAQETGVYHALLIAGFIFFLIFIAFVMTIFNYQKRNAQSYLLKMGADLRVVEREKDRMAADIHDEIGSRFSAIRMLVDQLLLGKTNNDTVAGKLPSLFRSLSLSIRQISNSMVPYALQEEGLEIAIEELISMLFPDPSIRVQTDYRVEDALLDKEATLYLYRIIQEILTNTAKHAKATEVSVTLHREAELVLLIHDNGTGFDEKRIRRSAAGVGLRNISARVKVLEGRIYLDTRPGEGTGYRIELPLL